MHYCICVCITFSVPWFFTLLQMQDKTGTLSEYSQHVVKVKALWKDRACCTLEQAEWSYPLPLHLHSCYPTRQGTEVETLFGRGKT